MSYISTSVIWLLSTSSKVGHQTYIQTYIVKYKETVKIVEMPVEHVTDTKLSMAVLTTSLTHGATHPTDTK